MKETDFIPLVIDSSRKSIDSRVTETIGFDEDEIALGTPEELEETASLLGQVMDTVNTAYAREYSRATTELYEQTTEAYEHLKEKLYLHQTALEAGETPGIESLHTQIVEFATMASLLLEEIDEAGDMSEEEKEVEEQDDEPEEIHKEDETEVEPVVPAASSEAEPKDIDTKVKIFIEGYPGGFAAFEKQFEAEFVSLIEKPKAKPNIFGRLVGYPAFAGSAFHAMSALEVGEVKELAAEHNEEALTLFLKEHELTKEQFAVWPEALVVWQGTGRLSFSNTDRFDVVARAAFIEHLKHKQAVS